MDALAASFALAAGAAEVTFVWGGTSVLEKCTLASMKTEMAARATRDVAAAALSAAAAQGAGQAAAAAAQAAQALKTLSFAPCGELRMQHPLLDARTCGMLGTHLKNASSPATHLKVRCRGAGAGRTATLLSSGRRERVGWRAVVGWGASPHSASTNSHPHPQLVDAIPTAAATFAGILGAACARAVSIAKACSLIEAYETVRAPAVCAHAGSGSGSMLCVG